jgi:hypothetical protein
MNASATVAGVDKQYLQLLLALANHRPTMPDQLTQFWLKAGMRKRAHVAGQSYTGGGVPIDDERLVRVVSMYVQMIVGDILQSATAVVDAVVEQVLRCPSTARGKWV